jgi:Holliday junction resolvase
MKPKRNRVNGVRKEGELQKLLEENHIFSLSLAPNIAGDIILPLHKVVIEVKSTKQYFSPFSTEKLKKQYEKLLSYNEQGIATYYAIFFNFKKEWKFFSTPLEHTKFEEGLSFSQFVEKISIS